MRICKTCSFEAKSNQALGQHYLDNETCRPKWFKFKHKKVKTKPKATKPSLSTKLLQLDAEPKRGSALAAMAVIVKYCPCCGCDIGAVQMALNIRRKIGARS